MPNVERLVLRVASPAPDPCHEKTTNSVVVKES